MKIYRIQGRITDPKMKTTFKREVRAVKVEDALEKIYSELGSKHKLKRYHIHIVKVEEISENEVKDKWRLYG